MSLTYLDTSALAKWYLNESLSEEVEAFLQSEGPCHISSLTRVEYRCLLARRRRANQIPAEVESAVFATFEQDIADGNLIVSQFEGTHFDDAVRLIETLADHPLRSLDALHLSVMRREGLSNLATADLVMAEAAEAIGFEVRSFHER